MIATKCEYCKFQDGLKEVKAKGLKGAFVNLEGGRMVLYGCSVETPTNLAEMELAKLNAVRIGDFSTWMSNDCICERR
jgi:hypothetical protein